MHGGLLNSFAILVMECETCIQYSAVIISMFTLPQQATSCGLA